METIQQERKHRMLDFRIQTFLEVCQDLNFTKAAQRLNITQPAVSQHIRWLEEAYGVKLFYLQGKKMMLTPAGEMLKNSAATISHDISCLRERMQETTSKKRQLRMGLTLTVAEFEAAHRITPWLSKNKDVSLFLSVNNTKELLKELESGTIDFALVEGNFPRNIYQHRLYSTERYIAVCAADNPLAKKPRTIEQLLGERLIVREAGSGTRNILEHYLEMKSMEISDFHAIIETGNIALIKKLTERDCGITFLYETAVREELLENRLCEISIKDMTITHDFSFIWREDSIFYEDYLKIFRLMQESREALSLP